MKYRIEIQPLAGRYVVALKDIPTGDFVKVLTVNASAAEIIRLLQDGYDTRNIADTLQQKYGISKERVYADVEALIKRLE
jgi:hypothetical protein